MFDVPNGKQIYGKSKNMKPEILRIKYREAQQKIKEEGAIFNKAKTIIIQNAETGNIINIHKTEEYNKKR